ncbi:hypothetical protein DFH09DRAFT_1322930 [Mycena vulgaris]|nr:hypothetical protein DFH09DRAFT_1322930 [Mycena vulgaris]
MSKQKSSKEWHKEHAFEDVEEEAQRWVYVGSIDPDMEEADLHAHFSASCDVHEVVIRYTGGLRAGIADTGFRYAIVLLASAEEVENALSLHRTQVPGSPGRITVEAVIGDLEEIQKAYVAYLDEGKAKTPAGTKVQTASGKVSSPVKAEKTQVWMPKDKVKKGRKEMFEFAMTLM